MRYHITNDSHASRDLLVADTVNYIGFVELEEANPIQERQLLTARIAALEAALESVASLADAADSAMIENVAREALSKSRQQ